MKKFLILSTLILSFASIFLACSEERDHANPFDPEYVIAPVSNITKTIISIDSIKLDWTINNNDNSDLYSFRIDKKTGVGTWVDNYKNISSNIQTFTDSVAINQTIEYKVIVTYDKNKSNPYNFVYVNTFPAPTNLNAVQTSITSANIIWTDNSKGEEKFEIERKLSTETAYLKISEITGDLTTGSKLYNDTTLELGKTFVYRLKAIKDTFSSSYVSFNYENVPSAPSELTAAVITDTSIKLEWLDNSAYEDGFKIDRKVGTTGTWVTDYASVGANVKTFTDTGLSTGTIYYYRVRAYYSTYNSSNSNEVNTILRLEFIEIPTGSFSMGSTLSSNSVPIHTVNITRPFYLGKQEVTQKEWQTTMGSNPAIGYGVGDNYPVYYVSWYAILVYCNKRSIEEGLTPCYIISGSTDPNTWGSIPASSSSTWNAVTCNFSAKGYRLPTEAEWEYAARYNDGRTYSWGETAPSSTLCNYNGNVGRTTAVGIYPSGNSNLGLCDMTGNVWEWVWDWYATYPSTTQTDPSGPTTAQSVRVFRGGSWVTDNNNIRCAYRDRGSLYYTEANLGFRLSRTK